LPATRLGHRTVRIQRADVDRLILNPRLRHGRTDSVLDVDPATVAPRAEWLKTGSPEHLVLFYDAERFVVDGVAEFLGPALRAGQRAVLVATPGHRQAVADRLRTHGIDVPTALAEGRLIELDAQETLSRFMVDGAPDATRFDLLVSELVERSPSATGPTHIFGEMVALLVAQGAADAALALEGLWNQAQTRHPFALLCAYPMDKLAGEDLAAVLGNVCSQHSTVVPAEGYSSLDSPSDRLHEIVALQQKAASLERALQAERAARDQAEAALQAREEFLSIASHELRTPVAVLLAQAQLSLRRLARTGELEPERVGQAMRTMGAQADKLSRLINQLLDISQLDAGKLELELRSVDLVLLVQQMVTTRRPLTNLHTITVGAPESLERWVDPLRLEQVLGNLLDNAVKYSPAGGAIHVALDELVPDGATISVRDHGLGIPLDKRDKIFERFYQAHENGFRSGMGLGLYVCREIASLHGGQIRVEFPEDGGTRVIVELPGRRQGDASA
jgi:signal transduction histidine kinase